MDSFSAFLFAQQVAQVDHGAHVVGPRTQGRPIAGFGLFELLEFAQRVGQVVVRLRQVVDWRPRRAGG